MREYTSKVDKLEEAEQERVTEAKEEKSKPIVMGEFLFKHIEQFDPEEDDDEVDDDDDDDDEDEDLIEYPGVGVHMAVVDL